MGAGLFSASPNWGAAEVFVRKRFFCRPAFNGPWYFYGADSIRHPMDGKRGGRGFRGTRHSRESWGEEGERGVGG